ncbi:MAG: ABC transporter ATP-binding protein [Pseudomonadota bacterium]
MIDPKPILVLDRLRKSYGALKVTDDVSLEIQRGELHALIGPNGAGKTTLVSEISGFVAPDGGRILFNGEDITRLPTHWRAHHGLARTFQITSVMAGFSVLENVALSAQAHNGTSFRFFQPASRDHILNDKAMTALETVGLQANADRPAGILSHGEKRQLELAMALAAEPDMLLLDEPMAGTGKDETERLIETLNGLKGLYTILLVEHDMRAVFALADQVSVLVYGQVIASGNPDAIRTDPQVRNAYLGEEEAA